MIRLAGAIASATLLAVPAAAGVPGMMSTGTEASPVRTHPLAPGERLLEVGGVGVVMARADLATLSVSISTGAANQAAARRANQADVRRAVEALRRAGIPADAIQTREGEGFARTIDVGLTSPPPDLAQQPAYDVTTLTVRLRDLDRIDAARAALREAGADNISAATYTIDDRGPARRRAQVQALAAARADAEAAAAAANMRIVRLVRVTERVGPDLFTIALNNEALFRGFRNMPAPSEPQTQPDIPVLVLLGADYALAPR